MKERKRERRKRRDGEEERKRRGDRGEKIRKKGGRSKREERQRDTLPPLGLIEMDSLCRYTPSPATFCVNMRDDEPILLPFSVVQVCLLLLLA